jgi:hypothetical protein
MQLQGPTLAMHSRDTSLADRFFHPRSRDTFCCLSLPAPALFGCLPLCLLAVRGSTSDVGSSVVCSVDLGQGLTNCLGGTLPDFRLASRDTCSSLLLPWLMLLLRCPPCSMVGVHGQHMGQVGAGLSELGVRESRMCTEGHVYFLIPNHYFACFWGACFPSGCHAVIG